MKEILNEKTNPGGMELYNWMQKEDHKVELENGETVSKNSRNLLKNHRIFYVIQSNADAAAENVKKRTIKFGIAGMKSKGSAYSRLMQYVRYYGEYSKDSKCAGVKLLFLGATKFEPPKDEADDNGYYTPGLKSEIYLRELYVKRTVKNKLDETGEQTTELPKKQELLAEHRGFERVNMPFEDLLKIIREPRPKVEERIPVKRSPRVQAVRQQKTVPKSEVGTYVEKEFDDEGAGKKKKFCGKVIDIVKRNEKGRVYNLAKVRYEDGDIEDMDKKELDTYKAKTGRCKRLLDGRTARRQQPFT